MFVAPLLTPVQIRHSRQRETFLLTGRRGSFKHWIHVKAVAKDEIKHSSSALAENQKLLRCEVKMLVFVRDVAVDS